MGWSIGLGKNGHLVADEEADPGMEFREADVVVAKERLRQGDVAMLLWLASRWPADGLPPAALWWREFANDYLKRFCAGTRNPINQVEQQQDWSRWLLKLVPMKGAEYLTASVLSSFQQRFADGIDQAVSRHPGGKEGWLREVLPHWHLVGRVTLHLAENPRNLDRPFAFLATYTSGLNDAGDARHLPLQQAVKDYAECKDREGLIRLLEPLKVAAETSDLMREMVDTGAIYRPQGWSPAQALLFLKEVPRLEPCGLTVRIPDWWRTVSKRRPLVQVTLGTTAKSIEDKGSLWSFDVAVTLDGETLTKEEMEALRTAQGLVLLKGRWVEADAEKLRMVMAHWQKARLMQFQGGMTFLQAMRTLSGLANASSETETPDQEQTLREWSTLVADGLLGETLDQLRHPEQLQDLDDHPDLKAQLRPYQAEGVNWMRLVTTLGLGACLADDMGLGKTVQVLALLLQLKRLEPSHGPSLLVAPASLLLNWQMEAEKFAPSLRIFIAHGSAENGDQWRWKMWAQGKDALLDEVDLVLTTYGMVTRLSRLQSQEWRLVILDEAQAIKNPASKQAQAVKRLQARSRIALTGTPIENRMTDLWSLFDFINPGLLGEVTAFEKWVKRMASGNQPDYSPLRRLVSPYLLRRLKTDKRIIQDLPDKIEMVSWCYLTKPQAVLYQQAVETLRATLSEVDQQSRSGVVLSALMTFKQICNHPSQHSGDVVYETALSGKFQRLDELAQGIMQRQEKVLVFTQFTQIIPALRALLRQVFRRDGLVLTGSTPVVERRKLVEAFQADDGPPFFILSLKVGGTGLTLTAANHVIHFDRWWNPAVENQATDRAYRIGQCRHVLVHQLVCRGTLEERIDRLINDKKALSEGVLGSGSDQTLMDLSNEELLELVTLDIRSAMDLVEGDVE